MRINSMRRLAASSAITAAVLAGTMLPAVTAHADEGSAVEVPVACDQAALDATTTAKETAARAAQKAFTTYTRTNQQTLIAKLKSSEARQARVAARDAHKAKVKAAKAARVATRAKAIYRAAATRAQARAIYAANKTSQARAIYAAGAKDLKAKAIYRAAAVIKAKAIYRAAAADAAVIKAKAIYRAARDKATAAKAIYRAAAAEATAEQREARKVAHASTAKLRAMVKADRRALKATWDVAKVELRTARHAAQECRNSAAPADDVAGA